ncbi:hypothetical protein ACTQ56_09945 [[Clostridium] aminophilum]|uniref:hypothetical protein n=1 Tax=[Clostridium] aminophilum TaxID=1526 RepID=UPI003F994076
MTFASFENMVSLLGTIVGLLYCVFKYIETPRRGYRIIIAFFPRFSERVVLDGLSADHAFLPGSIRVCGIFRLEYQLLSSSYGGLFHAP